MGSESLKLPSGTGSTAVFANLHFILQQKLSIQYLMECVKTAVMCRNTALGCISMEDEGWETTDSFI